MQCGLKKLKITVVYLRRFKHFKSFNTYICPLKHGKLKPCNKETFSYKEGRVNKNMT